MAQGSLVAVRGNAELDANPALMGGLVQATSVPPTAKEEPMLLQIVAYQNGLWEKAKREKIKHENRMIMNLRAKNSEYEPEVLAAIQATMGPNHKPTYMGITSTKCRAGKSWIRDYLFQPGFGNEPWDIQATPIPELPAVVQEKLFAETTNWVKQQALEFFGMTGQLPDESLMDEVLQALMPEAETRLESMIRESADTAAKKMRRKIADQFAEGGWEEALRDCVDDLVDIGTMILKGPVFTRSPVVVQEINPETGEYEPRVEDRIIQTYKRVNPLLFYPSPDASKNSLPWSFEKVRLTRKNLSDLRGQPGFNTEYINEVLREYEQKGLVEWTNVDQPKANVEGRTLGVLETELTTPWNSRGPLRVGCSSNGACPPRSWTTLTRNTTSSPGRSSTGSSRRC